MPENSTPTPRRGDPRRPYVLDVRPLGRRPGTLREERRRLPAPAGLGSDLVGVPAGAPLELDLRLEAVTEGVLVTGTVSTAVQGQCARCLDPIAEDLVADVQELFAYPDSATDATSGADEVLRVELDHIDLEPVVRDAVITALPWTPLCSPDCGGLCPECGGRRAELPPDHAHETLDPRWAALAALVPPDSGGTGGTDRSERTETEE